MQIPVRRRCAKVMAVASKTIESDLPPMALDRSADPAEWGSAIPDVYGRTPKPQWKFHRRQVEHRFQPQLCLERGQVSDLQRHGPGIAVQCLGSNLDLRPSWAGLKRTCWIDDVGRMQ